MNIEELMDENARLKAELRKRALDSLSDIGQLGEQSAEIAHLKAEVDALMTNPTSRLLRAKQAENVVLAIENDSLKAEVERLIKAGDAMVLKVPDIMAGCVRAEEAIGLMNNWIAAKEGKQS